MRFILRSLTIVAFAIAVAISIPQSAYAGNITPPTKLEMSDLEKALLEANQKRFESKMRKGANIKHHTHFDGPDDERLKVLQANCREIESVDDQGKKNILFECPRTFSRQKKDD